VVRRSDILFDANWQLGEKEKFIYHKYKRCKFSIIQKIFHIFYTLFKSELWRLSNDEVVIILGIYQLKHVGF